MPPTEYPFSVSFLADAAHVSKRRMLSALARNGGDPASALVSFGEPSASAEALAVAARVLGPDGGRDYRREYLRRQARRPEGVTAREAAGHRPPPVAMAMSALVEPGMFVRFEELTRSEARRVARYDSLLGQLDQGLLSPSAFRRRVRSWRPIRGERFLSDAEAALAILDMRRAAGDEVFVYEGRRS